MARIRSIKPEFWTSAQVMECSTNARLLFIGMWNFADDAGRHPDSPKQLKAEIFPADEFLLDDIRGMIDELSANGLVKRYVVEGVSYLQVTGWHHQRIDKPQKPRYPGPDQSDSKNDPGTIDDHSRLIRSDTIRKDTKGRELGPTDPVEFADAHPTANAPPPNPNVDSASVERIFEHWRVTWEHPRAQLDAKRRKLIREALKHYSEADLCQAVTGYRNSPHHMGDNDRGTVYDAIELMLRDAKHIDAGLKFYADPPRRDQSALTRRNVAATEDWQPPELRHANK